MLGTKPRFSIARLMVVISILAAECGLLRATWDTTVDVAIIFLPMLNFMLLGLSRLRPGHPARPFWIGFEMAAMTQVGLSWLLIEYAPEWFSMPAQWLQDHEWTYFGNIIIGITWLAAIYSLPQLLVASMVGWLSARYQVVRRPRATDPAGRAIEGDRAEILRALPTFGEGPRPAVG